MAKDGTCLICGDVAFKSVYMKGRDIEYCSDCGSLMLHEIMEVIGEDETMKYFIKCFEIYNFRL